MALFVVTYDLIKRKDYPQLWAELERLGGTRFLASAWFVERNWSAGELRSHLEGYIDDDDRLVVIHFHERPAWTKMLASGAQWVKARWGI